MTDFTATDNYSEIVLTPNTPRATRWAMDNAGKALRDDGRIAAAPGYVAHVFVPAIREAGMTVDGDVDQHGNIRLRVQT